MEKEKPDQTVSGRPIAKRIQAKMKLQWQRKVVNIKSVTAGRRIADEMQNTVVSQKDLAGFHPAHAAYVYTQNQASVMSEQLTALKEMQPFVDIISRAEDLYMPSAPPMSPLTTFYFSCWAFFDACAGPAAETIGTTIWRSAPPSACTLTCWASCVSCRIREWASTFLAEEKAT